MTSAALHGWRSTRSQRLDRLESAHTAIGGSGPGRRWVTEELNHALLIRAFTTTRRLNRANASPDALRHDFGLLGLEVWIEIEQRYPARANQWRERLAWLNQARNGLAHSDEQKLESVVAAGWPLTLHSVRRWRSTLDMLATGMDLVAGQHLDRVFGVRAW